MKKEYREEMLQTYSDYHKEAYGFRPRYNYWILSDEELQTDLDRFGKVVDESIARTELYEKQAIAVFEKTIKDAILCGAENEDQAIKWLFEAELDQDIEQFVWNQGFLFTDYGRQLVNRIEGLMTSVN